MKLRTDFVTNSSSSSFIISTNKGIPEGRESSVIEVTLENLAEILSKPYEYEEIVWNGDDKLKELAELEGWQMALIKLAIQGDLNTYDKIKNILAGTSQNIYNIFEDRDWLYYQDDLNSLIDSSEILYKETDL